MLKAPLPLHESVAGQATHCVPDRDGVLPLYCHCIIFIVFSLYIIRIIANLMDFGNVALFHSYSDIGLKFFHCSIVVIVVFLLVSVIIINTRRERII